MPPRRAAQETCREVWGRAMIAAPWVLGVSFGYLTLLFAIATLATGALHWGGR